MWAVWRYLIRQVMEEMDCEGIKVIATGGLSRMIAQQTDRINIVDPMLNHGTAFG